MDEQEEKKKYFIIIPPEIREDKRLLPLEKILYGEIVTLSKKKGYCFSNNKYFGDVYNVHKNTIGKYINNLIKLGYLRVENTPKERLLYILPLNAQVDTPQSIGCDPSTYTLTPLNLYVEHNNIINNINNNKINKIDSLQENVTKIDREKLGVYEKESISNEFLNNFNKYKDLASKATGLDRSQVDMIILPVKLRNKDIGKLISKVEESDFLLGKLINKPRISNFSSEHCLNLMLADNYKNKGISRKSKKPEITEDEIDNILDSWGGERQDE